MVQPHRKPVSGHLILGITERWQNAATKREGGKNRKENKKCRFQGQINAFKSII